MTRGDRPALGERPALGDRPRRPERRDPPPLRNDPPPAEREFWEVWSEERTQADAPVLGEAAPPQPNEIADGGILETTWGATPAPEQPVRSAPAETSENVARLYLNLGRKDGASEREIRDLIAAHAGEVALSDVDVMNTHTYLNVPPADADRVVAALAGRELAGRQIICESAKPRRR